MCVGVEVLDEDHRKLVAMINELYGGLRAGHGKDTLGHLLDGLVNYTKIHFAHEEQLFAQTDYPGAAAHKKEHDDLTQQVLAVQAKFKEGAVTSLSLEVMGFLKEWLTTHIQGSDPQYGPHMNASGIE